MRKLLIIIILLFTFPAFAADENFALDGTASSNILECDPSGSCTEVGSPSDIKDDDESTALWTRADAAGGSSIKFEHQVDLSKSIATINKVELVARAEAGEELMYAYVHDLYVYLYYNSSWNLVYTIYDNDDAIFSKTTFSNEGTWNDVSKIKVYCYSSGTNRLGYPVVSGMSTYELRAWGTDYEDRGVRVYNGTSVIKIGTQDLDGHKLRVRKDGTTYGIPLLDTSDNSASPIRIYDGSNVKSLPEVD